MHIIQNSRQWSRRSWIYLFLVCIVIVCPVSGISSQSETDLWKALSKGSTFVLLRHAIAPGTGDPDFFDIEDCSTQRNLSDAGRTQAAEIGTLFRMHGIKNARVFSSQWCRCLETAKLLDLGVVDELSALNSFFHHYGRRDTQTQSLRKWISKWNLEQPLVLVTHQVNITSLTGIYPSSGELVFVNRSKSGEISVLGSVKTD